MKKNSKEDKSKYNKEWYSKNRDARRLQIEGRKSEIKEWFKLKKSELKCEICGESHIACIDFHHNDPSKKEGNVASYAVYGWSKERISDEISKCSILCSNCHRKKHYIDELHIG